MGEWVQQQTTSLTQQPVQELWDVAVVTLGIWGWGGGGVQGVQARGWGE
jgi:hypothetical protein